MILFDSDRMDGDGSSLPPHTARVTHLMMTLENAVEALADLAGQTIATVQVPRQRGVLIVKGRKEDDEAFDDLYERYMSRLRYEKSKYQQAMDRMMGVGKWAKGGGDGQPA